MPDDTPTPTDQWLDGLLKEALEPEPRTVRRVIRASLAAPERRRGWRLVWAAAAAAFVLGVGLLALAPWRQAEPPPQQLQAVQAEAIVISNEGGVLTVTTPSGCEWVSVAGGDS